MSKTVTDADRLAAEGITVPSLLGPLRLRYGFRALRRLEEKYGGLEELQAAMEAVTGSGQAFGPLLDIVLPGLSENPHTEDELLDALLPHHVKTYVDAMVAAMQEAFPDAAPAQAGQGNPPAQAAPASPGPSGTTSPRAATAAPRKRSGR